MSAPAPARAPAGSSDSSGKSDSSGRFGSAGLYLRLLCVPLFWGGTYPAGRIIAAEMPVTAGVLLRYLIATAALMVVLHWREGLGVLRRFDRRQWRGILWLALTGVTGNNLLLLGALSMIPASRSAPFMALTPLATMSIGALLLHEPQGAARWIGALVALAGVLIVVTNGDPTQLHGAFGTGELMMLGAVLSWSAYTLIGRRVLRTMSPLAASTAAAMVGTMLLAIPGVPGLMQTPLAAVTASAWISIVYSALLGTTVAFVWYYEGVRRIGASRASVLTNLVPVFGVLLGWLVLDEPLHASLALGASIAVAGVLLVNRPAAQRR